MGTNDAGRTFTSSIPESPNNQLILLHFLQVQTGGSIDKRER